MVDSGRGLPPARVEIAYRTIGAPERVDRPVHGAFSSIDRAGVPMRMVGVYREKGYDKVVSDIAASQELYSRTCERGRYFLRLSIRLREVRCR